MRFIKLDKAKALGTRGYGGFFIMVPVEAETVHFCICILASVQRACAIWKGKQKHHRIRYRT